MSTTQITREWLENHDACEDGLEFFDSLGVESISCDTLIDKLPTFSWKIWIIVRLLSAQNNVKFARFCAKSAAKSAAEWAEWAEYAAKSAAKSAESAAKYAESAAKSAEYAESAECAENSGDDIIAHGLKLIGEQQNVSRAWVEINRGAAKCQQ